MNDRELLKLAAKAAGYTLKWGETYIVGDDAVDCTDMSYVVSGQPDEADWLWSPLEDDGHALQLAVKLMEFEPYKGKGYLPLISTNVIETRRAIVRAAAEIGKAL